MPFQNCPVCASNDWSQFHYGLILCNNCSLKVSPEIWRLNINSHLESEWFGEDYNPETSIWVKNFERLNNKKTLKRISRHSKYGASILEIGVGSGSFLYQALQRGYAVRGIDLSPVICQRILTKYQIPVFCGSLDEFTSNEKFDVIVINHVLEHVESPIEFLRQLKLLLKTGGCIHIALPNADCWEANLRGWGSYEPYHLTYFNARCLSKAISKVGLEIISMYSIDSFSGWFMAIIRTALGYKLSLSQPVESMNLINRKRSFLVEHLYRLTMVAVGVITWPMRILQSKLGYGDEIICIVAKPKEGG